MSSEQEYGDKLVLESNRPKKLKDDPESGLQVKVPVRDQIIQKLYDKCIDLNISQCVVKDWQKGNANRAEWLDRQQEFLQEFDEFLEPIYESSTDWGSTLHMPTVLTVAKTYHARMFSALMSIDPPFTVRSRTSANSDRAPLVQDLMRYTLKDWCNDYQGVEETVDRWLWDWVTKGCGILKCRWSRKFTRYMDVLDVKVPGPLKFQTDPSGRITNIGQAKIEEEEIERVEKIFEGPQVDRINAEDLLIVGGEGDPQKADSVTHAQWLTADELWQAVDQGVFNRDAVEAIIAHGQDYQTAEPSGQIKEQQAIQAGMAGLNTQPTTPRYEVLESYRKVDLDKSGIASDIIVWVNPATNELLRATYLYRVMTTGLRPFFKIDFHKRNNTEYGVGVVELLYSISKEIDAMHNMRMDTGLLTSLPWGFYRPSASMEAESLPIEPGSLIPLDNPGQDVFFPNLGNRVSFGFQEEGALYQQIERLMSISDLSLGIIAGQGATRTATGTRAILGEANANLDIFLKRMNRGWRQFLIYLFQLLQYKIEPGFQFRVLGDDGSHYWESIKSREQLAGMFDFELEGNSSNSNKQIQVDVASQVFQLTQNPILLQLGIVSPANVYEATKMLLQVNGIKDIHKYLTKPQNVPIVYTPGEIANRVLRGIDVPLDPTQDLAGFIAYAQEFMGDDQLMGQFEITEIRRLAAKMQDAVAMQQAVQSAQAQAANSQQMQLNRAQGTQVSGPNAAIPQPVGTQEA